MRAPPRPGAAAGGQRQPLAPISPNAASCRVPTSAAQLSARQQGALFAQFSLPLVNFHLLGYVAREIIPPQFHLTPTTAAAPEVHELRSASAMEEIIPAC